MKKLNFSEKIALREGTGMCCCLPLSLFFKSTQCEPNQRRKNSMNCKRGYPASKMLIWALRDLINLFVEVKIKLSDSKCYSDKMEFSIILWASGPRHRLRSPAPCGSAVSEAILRGQLPGLLSGWERGLVGGQWKFCTYLCAKPEQSCWCADPKGPSCLLKNAHGFAPLYSLKVKGPLPFALPYSSHTQNNLPISSTLFSQSQRAPLICSPISPHIFALPNFSHTPNAHPICATLSSQIQRVPPNCSAIFLGS